MGVAAGSGPGGCCRAALCALAAFPALAAQGATPAPQPLIASEALTWNLDGGSRLTIKGTVAYQAVFRAQDPSADLLPPGNARRIGLTGTAPGGTNVDDGNLNYGKGNAVSSALRGLFDLELQGSEFRAFVRARGWDDYALRRDGVPHGNVPNGYLSGTPLSDTGFSGYGQFTGGVLMDAYVEYVSASRPLVARLGSQAINWGRPDATILGGLEQINAVDYVARTRGGGISAREGYVPVPAIWGRWGKPEGTAFEAFYLFRYHENELPGCGTFFALADYVTDGCDKVVAQPAAVSDPAGIAAGLFARRAPDVKPPHSGQFGFAATHTVADAGRFGAYFASYHSRRFASSAVKSTRLSLAPLIPGDPGGENVRYAIQYPEDVRMYGLSFDRTVTVGQFKGARLYAEYTYRPNQSVLLSSTDLFNAFASNVAPSQLRADAAATAPGAIYHGYDRRKISQFSFIPSAPLGSFLGGKLIGAAEIGFKYIHDLPDVNVRRYLRSEIYGLGPVAGTCAAGASAVQCSNEGYVTPFSWGYRARAIVQYPQAIPDVDVTATIAFGQDVNGYSHDIMFIEGRKLALLALRADIRKNLFVEAQWWPNWGGAYNFNKDRDYYTVAAGINF